MAVVSSWLSQSQLCTHLTSPRDLGLQTLQYPGVWRGLNPDHRLPVNNMQSAAESASHHTCCCCMAGLLAGLRTHRDVTFYSLIQIGVNDFLQTEVYLDLLLQVFVSIAVSHRVSQNLEEEQRADRWAKEGRKKKQQQNKTQTNNIQGGLVTIKVKTRNICSGGFWEENSIRVAELVVWCQVSPVCLPSREVCSPCTTFSPTYGPTGSSYWILSLLVVISILISQELLMISHILQSIGKYKSRNSRT